MAVRLEGALALRKALRKFEPELAKEQRKEMAKALKPVVKKARGFVPANDLILTNWQQANASSTAKFPYFDFKAAKAGIGYRTTPAKPNRHGFRALARIENKTASGAIFETAGRKNPQGRPWDPKNSSKKYSHSANRNAGKQFIDALNNAQTIGGSGLDKGRAIFKAWEQDHGKAQDGVIRAIETAARKFKARTLVK